jgi:hypothetical protein
MESSGIIQAWVQASENEYRRLFALTSHNRVAIAAPTHARMPNKPHVNNQRTLTQT